MSISGVACFKFGDGYEIIVAKFSLPPDDIAFFAAIGAGLSALMGGHQSKQSVNISTSVVSNIVQKSTLSCLTYMNGTNIIDVVGNDNVVIDTTQQVSITVNSDCISDATQQASLQANLTTNITQAIKDQEVALTQWMDHSSDDNEAALTQSVTSNVTLTTAVTCLNSLNGSNAVYVAGNSNVVKKSLQTSTSNLISQCLLSQGQVTNTIADITDTLNQHNDYTSENPFAFITDAIEAIAKSAMMLIAVIFILLICFVVVFESLHHKKTTPLPVDALAYPL